MKALVVACIATITREAGGRKLEPSQMRAALVICLRDQHACTLEQIAEVVALSAERVRQLYQATKRMQARIARAARAPVEELSARAFQGLRDAGLGPDASMHDVTLLLPMLRLAAKAPQETGSNASFQHHQVDRATVREIEDWLGRHGVTVR